MAATEQQTTHSFVAFSVLVALLRITWRSVAAVIARVVAEQAARTNRLRGLRRIGMDEISYRKGHWCLLCVVDHDTGRLVWAGKGRDAATLLTAANFKIIHGVAWPSTDSQCP